MSKQSASPARISWRHILLLAGVAALGWTADFLSKEWILANFAERESREVLGEALQFTFVRNPGAAFSFASGMTWIFTILAVAVTIGIIITARKLHSVGWALVLGGLLGGVTGNLYDRLTRWPGAFEGHVVDFIHVWGFPAIFNIADICIVVSMCGLVLLVLLNIGIDGQRHTDESEADEAETPADTAEAS
ncbi:signal peptidase II [Agrococcus casei]|uniref:signal peptidase II n=1 Tax=Agrococcus casei TaxID=343512 RepID=UPI003F92F7DD